MRAARCNSCQAPIIWARTARGLATPFDAEPNESGEWVIRSGLAMHASPLLDAGRPRYMPHWASGPNADEHRKKGER